MIKIKKTTSSAHKCFFSIPDVSPHFLSFILYTHICRHSHVFFFFILKFQAGLSARTLRTLRTLISFIAIDKFLSLGNFFLRKDYVLFFSSYKVDLSYLLVLSLNKRKRQTFFLSSKFL
jgi:hypothetical protein